MSVGGARKTCQRQLDNSKRGAPEQSALTYSVSSMISLRRNMGKIQGGLLDVPVP